jgi:alpha-tubulin suppressor-like RCC1 family protein
MRAAVVLASMAAACGRIDFDTRASGDAATGGGDGPAITMWTNLTAYGDTTCAVRAGATYCWGDNTSGKLGAAGPDVLVPSPIAVPGPPTALSLGLTAACAVVDSQLYCWGDAGAPAPTMVPLPTAPTAVSVGHGFQCAIAGDAFCWGAINGVGQLGTNDTSPHANPTAVAHAGAAYTAIKAGDDHACALDADGVAWCWGHNDDGVLGIDPATTSSTTPVMQSATIKTLPQIAGWHACAMTSATDVGCWGDGGNGQLGNGGTALSATPVAVLNLVSPTFLATGGGPTDRDASCVIDRGDVRCWGNGYYGRLGQGSTNPSTTPVDVLGLPAAASEVAIGDDHACAALVDGDLYCWGRGDFGQLGDGLGTTSMTPVKVVVP